MGRPGVLVRLSALLCVCWALAACSEPTTTPTADTGPPPPAVDIDGDGVGEKLDCDDEDDDVWSNEPYEGDLVQLDEIASFCEGYCRRNIQGSLILREGAILEGLECVRRVTGDLVVAGQVEDVSGLESITNVGGSLRIEYLDRLARLVGLQIGSVGGDLTIANNVALTRLGLFRHLATIGGDLVIEHNPNLELLAGRALKVVGGGVSVQDNLKLNDMTGLTEVTEVQGGGITLRENPSMGPFTGFTLLTTVAGPVVLDDHVASQAFQRLVSAPEVRLVGADAPRQIDGFASLRSIDGDLIMAHGQETQLLVDGLRSLTFVGGDLVVEDVSVVLPHVLQGLSAIREVGGQLRLRSDGVLDLSFLNQLRSVGGLQVTGCGRLTSINGGVNLRSINGDLDITRNQRLESIAALFGLESVQGEVRIKSNPVLSDLTGLSALGSIGGDLELNSNWHELKSLDGLNAVETIGGDLTLQYNYHLEDLTGLYGLRQVGGDVCFNANARLAQEEAFLLIREIDVIQGNIDYELAAGLCDI